MNPGIRLLPLPSANGLFGGRMNGWRSGQLLVLRMRNCPRRRMSHKLANGMKMWKGIGNTTTLLFPWTDFWNIIKYHLLSPMTCFFLSQIIFLSRLWSYYVSFFFRFVIKFVIVVIFLNNKLRSVSFVIYWGTFSQHKEKANLLVQVLNEVIRTNHVSVNKFIKHEALLPMWRKLCRKWLVY